LKAQAPLLLYIILDNYLLNKGNFLMRKIQIFVGVFLLLIFTGCGSTTNTTTNNRPIIEDEVNYKSKFINSTVCNQIIDKEFITICYDYKLKGAKSVAYRLDGDLMYDDSDIAKRPSFYKEPALEKKYQIINTDYSNSGYDRGHLAPDASFDWSQESLDAVYTFANIIPQAPQVNRKMWVKVEKFARDKAVDLGLLNVINVVQYSKNHKNIGKNRMAVSRGFYKVLYNNSEKYKECFYYSNRLNASSREDTIEKHKVDCSKVSY
jgi:endonuclease G